MEANIKEIFSSIQGEGPVVGFKQLFIRFCGCNLECKYCDTNYNIKNSTKYSPNSLIKKIYQEYDLSNIHSISLTGGEPLLYSEFIKEFSKIFKEKTNIKIYLETNATLYKELLKVKDYIDIISADIKLPSCSGKDTFDLHEKFLSHCKGVYTFAKIVFNQNITDDEIKKCSNLAKDNNIELVLQPEMYGNKMNVSPDLSIKILDKFLSHYKNVRLIPQTHKFINVL